jgi:hypothetical protein
MGRSALALVVTFACFGCSTLPSRYATPEEEESGIVDVSEYVSPAKKSATAENGAKKGEASDAAAPAGPPGTEDVGWEDNGIPIRQLTGDGPPQEMKLPGNDMKMQMKKKGVKPAVPTSTPSTLPQN